MITLQFHVRHADDTEFWWVDSPDVPGLRVFSPRLVKCCRLALSVLDLVHVDRSRVSYVLATV